MQWCLDKLISVQSTEAHSFTDPVNTILELAIAEEQVIRRVFARNDRSHRNGSVLHHAEGLLNVFDQVPDQVKRAFPRLSSDQEPDVPVVIQPATGLVHSFPRKHLFALPDDMKRAKGSPTIVPDMAAFLQNFDIFTNRAFINMRHWDNIAVAGGAVLACMQPTSFDASPWTPLQANMYFENFYPDSDVDLFIYGLNAEEAEARMVEVYQDITSALLQPAICVRKAGNITIRAKGVRPIQIILRLYHGISEILCGFDIDAACCLYDSITIYYFSLIEEILTRRRHSGTNVWANIRCLMACMRQANTIDLSRRSPSYEVRNQKYGKRGFEVYIPSLQRERIDVAFVYNQWIHYFPPGLVRLFIYEYLGVDPFYYVNLHYPGKRIRRARVLFGRVMDFTPVENSSYDRVWAHLPGVDFSADEIVRHIDNMNALMNSPYKQSKYQRRIHRHFISYGTMQQCINGINCINCPPPVTDEEKNIVQEESTRYIRGRISFIEDNPGRQFVGSFSPITEGDWEVNAYRQFGPVEPPSSLARHFTNWGTLRRLFNP
ncbi:hypothetical protein JR316_0009531 [Psilocybe cubensis]|uniref:Uncharacterized protein n=2 Tax=Psilocybe cubensis TaxID=181762 RepID=A0ACB8GQ30_PSICU|nr:hypothetical protein JR316_0009531 [Psilocybe cubensis]KAH9477326.1 hypothetical protein JR316_0009531 [Psilocybe cubensis]